MGMGMGEGRGWRERPGQDTKVYMGSVEPLARSVWGSASSFETSVTAAKLWGLGSCLISLGSTHAVRSIILQQSLRLACNSVMSSPPSNIVWNVVTLLFSTIPQLKHLGGTNLMAAVLDIIGTKKRMNQGGGGGRWWVTTCPRPGFLL